MKRIILVLLALSCFRFSYAEELTAEQQQLAWNYIYNLTLSKSKDFHPVVFKDDIIINLKGKVTSEDSMVVKNIIKDFQKAIPHLKISLSDHPGNLILGLDFNKMHSITSTFNLFEAQSRKVQFSIPDTLTNYQRKQVIYYWLYKGLISFNYNNSSVNILGMKGCVFCENDFDSITFSPFDLFILEKLYSPDFSNQLARNLSAELQQLAWKFIYENMLGRGDQPLVFHNDIRINLVGKVTREDSVIVQDFVKEIQNCVPRFKIGLDKQPGNFIIWINNKEGNYNSKMKNWSEITLARLHLQIPDNYSIDQRKKFIYFKLLREGFVFFYKKPLYIQSGMPGCVYNVASFDLVTFSPFDLFIIEKLYSTNFPIQLAGNLSTELQETAWRSITDKFMGQTKEPVIYKTDIAIKLEGMVSSVDSVCMLELIDEIRLIIPNRKIFLTKEKANIVFNLLSSNSGVGSSIKTNGKSIQAKTINLFFNPGILDKELIERTFYFHLMRSLVDFSPSRSGSPEIEGCVFDEKSPDFIKFHKLDAFILNKLYADDFSDQFKSYWIKKWQARSYYSFMYFIQLRTAGILIGILLAIFLFSALIKRGIFRFHNWKLNRFIIQILWIAIIYDIYNIVNLAIRNLSFQFFLFEPNFFGSFVFMNLSILLIPILFFVIERKMNTLDIAAKNKLLLLIANSFIISFSITLVYLIVYLRNNFEIKVTYSVGVSFVFASVRFLLFTFSELKKNEQREKDIEFTILKEKSKQAELQSLRAKINPHFLYNALNSIASLATTDARKTEQMALALSDFFKYAINREQKQLNTLSEELNAIRTYLEIEKARFGDRLSFEIDCPADLLEIQIPQLLIQPLVENAIKHGLSQITENGLIGILICKEENQLKIRVYDNGPAFPDGPLSGFGIQNTQERIALLYGTKASINWQNGAEKYIEISIPV